MDLTLASIIKSALIMAFLLPAFAIIAMTVPQSPSFLNTQNSTVSAAMIENMNQTSSLISQHFLLTVSGLNSTLGGSNGSFSANPTIFQAFAFIVQGFGTVMQDMVMLPLLDLWSMNFIANGMQFALPAYMLGVVKVGIGLLYAYMLLSLLFIGVSAIQKFDIKNA